MWLVISNPSSYQTTIIKNLKQDFTNLNKQCMLCIRTNGNSLKYYVWMDAFDLSPSVKTNSPYILIFYSLIRCGCFFNLQINKLPYSIGFCSQSKLTVQCSNHKLIVRFTLTDLQDTKGPDNLLKGKCNYQKYLSYFKTQASTNEMF